MSSPDHHPPRPKAKDAVSPEERGRTEFGKSLERMIGSAMKADLSRAVLERTWTTVSGKKPLLFPGIGKGKEPEPPESVLPNENPLLRERIVFTQQLQTERPFPVFPDGDALQQGLDLAVFWAERKRMALLLDGLPLGEESLALLYEQPAGFPHPFAPSEKRNDAFSIVRKRHAHEPRTVLDEIQYAQHELEVGVLEALGDAINEDLLKKNPEPIKKKQADVEQCRIHIRWMIRRDMPEVLQAEQLSYEYSWNEEDFLRCLRQRNCIGMVAEHGEKIIGYMVYELHKNKLNILNMAVHPAWRRIGVGAQMCHKLISKLSSHRRTAIEFVVAVGNKNGRAFLEKQEFKPRRLLHNAFHAVKSPGLLMRYDFGESEGDDGSDIQLLENVFGENCIREVLKPPSKKKKDGADAEDKEDDETEDDESGEEPQEWKYVTQDPRKALAILWKIVGERENIRRQALDGFREWIRTPDRQMTTEIIRKGWGVLAEIKTATDEEWVGYLNRQKPGEAPRECADPSKAQKSYRLDKVIHCNRYRHELTHLQGLNNIRALDAKEKAIVHEVFAAIMTYPYGMQSETPQQPLPPTHCVAAPHYTVTERAVNCFSGPWLTATMLLRCGIPYKHLYFCRSNDASPSHFDAHGSLLVRTYDDDLMVLDTAYRQIGHPLRLAYANDEHMKKNLQNLLDGKDHSPVRFEIQKERARELRLPYRMQVVPLAEGFAALHLLHVGLSFRTAGEHNEAVHAYELGLTYNPMEPSLHYELGLVAFLQGKLERAKLYLERALALDDDLLYTRFTLAEIAIVENNFDLAREHLKIFADDKRKAFRDEGSVLKRRANKYLKASDDGMVALWQKRNKDDDTD